MFSVIVTQSSNASGAGILVAKGHGKQKTTRLDHALSTHQNIGAAAGALLNNLLDPRQQAKVHHPSGGQRVRIESLSDGGGKHRVTLDV